METVQDYGAILIPVVPSPVDNLSWNTGGELHFNIPLVSNVAMTAEETFPGEYDPGLHFPFIEDYNNSHSNCSSCGSTLYNKAPTFQQSALTRVIVLLLIAIFSLVGNMATLSSILRTGRQGTSTVYMLLVQLAIADLLVSIFCILADALWTLSVQWYGGNILCKAVKFMQLFSLYLSTFLLVLIGFDRLCAVRFPMRRARAKHYVRTGIVCVWMSSAVLSLPQVFIFSVMRGPFTEEFWQCVTYGFYTAQWQEQLYTTLSLVLMFLLPLGVLIATYMATFITIASQENVFTEKVRSPSVLDSARQKVLRRAKFKSLMITVVIVLAFVVCWTPYYVTMIIFIFLEPGEQLSRDLQAAVFFFGSSSAAINPLIYGAFHLRPRIRTSRTTNDSSATYYSYLAFRRSHGRRKSREENIDLHRIDVDSLSKRYCSVSHNRRLVHPQSSKTFLSSKT